MAATILDHTVSSTTERGVEINQGEILRPWKDDSWTQIRVGMRYFMLNDTGSTPSAGTYSAFGLCSGASGPLSVSTPHALLTGNFNSSATAASITRGTVTGGIRLSSTSNYLIKIENSSRSAINISPWSIMLQATSSSFYTSVSWLDITRGTPYVVRHGYNAALGTVISADTFVTQMQAAGDPAFTNHNIATVSGGASVDESTYGTFDHVCVSWNINVPTFIVTDLIVVKLA